jgi:hypothetical protein
VLGGGGVGGGEGVVETQRDLPPHLRLSKR